MAEIKIKEKKRSVLPWVIVIVVLAIIAVAYWYFTHDNKNTIEQVKPDTGMMLLDN